MKTEQKYKKDGFLIGILLVAALLLLIVQYRITEQKGDMVTVTVDGAVTGVYSLTEDRTIPIETVNGMNILVIQNGYAFVKEADCPDQICVKQQRIDRHSQSIVCLPHKVVITVQSSIENETDSMAY